MCVIYEFMTGNRGLHTVMHNVTARAMLAMIGFFFVVCSYAAEISSLLAGSPEEAGIRVATEARERQRGFGNSTANLTMTLRNKQGRETVRELRLKRLEIDGDGDRTLLMFDRPRDVRGTAFLIHAHKEEPDQQWLYLPALKRVKGVSSANQSGSFMGSEFSYEDLGAVEVEKFTHRYLRQEPCGDIHCIVLERIPKSLDSGYSRQLVWYDQEELRTMQIHFYDRRDKHLKTMVVEGYQKYLDRFWRSSSILMTNHLTKKTTLLRWSDYEFDTGLEAKDFTRTALKRVR